MTERLIIQTMREKMIRDNERENDNTDNEREWTMRDINDSRPIVPDHDLLIILERMIFNDPLIMMIMFHSLPLNILRQ